MDKDFDGWNKEKKQIHWKKHRIFCHPREIWWCALGVNIGFEQDGTGRNFDRPVLVIRGFNENIFLGVALTGIKRKSQYYLPIGKIEGIEASVILSQVRLIDTKRLIKKMATLDNEVFGNVKIALKKALFG